VRFAYEWHDDSGHWSRSYGNENWEFDADGLMRAVGIHQCVPIRESTGSIGGRWVVVRMAIPDWTDLGF